MKIHLVSDLHLDHDKQADEAFVRDYRNEDQADVLVVAGDLYSTARPKATGDFLRLMGTMYRSVLFVLGNHDTWLATPEWVRDELVAETAGDPNVHVFFEPNFKTIDGQRFLGGTMHYPKPKPHQLQDFIDMRQTRAPREWFFDLHQLFLKALEDVQPTDVVITHHLPHPGCTPPQFRGSFSDHFFCVNMTDEILKYRPRLWLAGHTHESCDFEVGDTRIVIQPRGYPFEWRVRSPYKPKLIEIP